MPSAELPLVLVVDDDPDLRKLISEFLANHGFRVATAESSAAMRQYMSQVTPDVVILDVMMPGEDGLSAARYLAAESGLPKPLRMPLAHHLAILGELFGSEYASDFVQRQMHRVAHVRLNGSPGGIHRPLAPSDASGRAPLVGGATSGALARERARWR